VKHAEWQNTLNGLKKSLALIIAVNKIIECMCVCLYTGDGVGFVCNNFYCRGHQRRGDCSPTCNIHTADADTLQ